MAPSAISGGLFGLGKGQMWFIRAVIIGTHSFSQLSSGEQAIGFNDSPFAMHPFRFNGIEPGALFGQEQGQDANAFARLLHLLIVLPDPGTDDLADMPGGMIPDQEPGGFALFGQAIRAPLEKLGRDAALGTARDKA